MADTFHLILSDDSHEDVTMELELDKHTRAFAGNILIEQVAKKRGCSLSHLSVMSISCDETTINEVTHANQFRTRRGSNKRPQFN